MLEIHEANVINDKLIVDYVGNLKHMWVVQTTWLVKNPDVITEVVLNAEQIVIAVGPVCAKCSIPFKLEYKNTGCSGVLIYDSTKDNAS